MHIPGNSDCLNPECLNDVPMRCARKSCRRVLADAAGEPLAMAEVELLPQCRYCGGRVAEKAQRYCVPCHSDYRQKKKPARCSAPRCPGSLHPPSKNGRCMYRNFREYGLQGLTAEQLEWFRRQVKDSQWPTAEQVEWLRQQVKDSQWPLSWLGNDCGPLDAKGRGLLEFIIGENWKIIGALGDLQFAGDPLTERRKKILRRSIIRKPTLK